MSKIVSKDKSKLVSGLNIVADAVKVTIGPRGRNVIIDGGLHPTIANDGGRISKEIVLKDPIENMGASVIKEVIQKTTDDVGGGRTASAILTQSLVNEGLKLLDKGVNVNLIKKGMNLACNDICNQLDKISKPVKSLKELEQVATISTENEELGKIIAETVQKVGKDGIVTVESSNAIGITSHIEEGLKCNQGYISPYMVTNERGEAEYEDIAVLITDKKLSSFKELVPFIESVAKTGKKDLFVICETMEAEALNVSVINRLKGAFNILAIKTPGVGDLKKFTSEDLCALTGAELYTDQTEGKLGKAKKVIARKDSTIILGTGDVKTWVDTLKTRQEIAENKWEKDQYAERIAKLQNGIAVIKVGANSETELKYLKLKIEDGVNETKRAIEEGIIPGGDVAYLNALKGIEFTFKDNTPDEVKLGYDLVCDAIEAPLRQIVINSDDSPDVVVELIKANDSNTIGYNALTGETVDMFKEGIIDAVKVSKTVLQNAISASSMFLSIDTIISEEPQKDV